MPRRGDSDALHGISIYLQINITIVSHLSNSTVHQLHKTKEIGMCCYKFRVLAGRKRQRSSVLSSTLPDFSLDFLIVWIFRTCLI
jgi:hypothetical protein